ncbi:MAG TPA: DUF4412 domain-containing protein [Flavobacteriaceae bacterium]|nr:DUF4412 domain-containing protein [Flavobacteriaceae bacterium]
MRNVISQRSYEIAVSICYKNCTLDLYYLKYNIMKHIISLLFILALTVTGMAQEGIYLKYEADVETTSEDGEMMAMMMSGSTMELAISPEKNWVRTVMGTMMTLTLELNIGETNEMTMLMEGMMGTMAFQGNPDDLKDDAEEAAKNNNIEYVDATKEILGYTCKKAIMTDMEGNTAIFWYTEKIKRPEGISQMPDDLPGLSLQFESSPQGGVTLTYTAIEVKKKVDMSEYNVNVPVGTEIQDLEDMSKMGGG